MVLFVLCFGVEFLCCLDLMCVFISLLSSGGWVVAYWKIAAHSAYDMFSKCEYLIVNLVFPTSVFRVGIFLIAPFS